MVPSYYADGKRTSTSISRHHGGTIDGPLKPLIILSHHYSINGFKGDIRWFKSPYYILETPGIMGVITPVIFHSLTVIRH